MNKLLVTGSRAWTDRDLMAETLDELLAERNTIASQVLLIEGEAPGADVMARDLWWERGGPVLGVPANWQIGRQAGVIRNQRMVDMMPDLVVGFLTKHSRGTSDCLARAREVGIETQVVSA